ncbi:MAG: PAS domain-containing sensor histidine kinase, partial [Opitutae bacterium]|nr:PAS domain-containing sensor histidine kinase [Opitutae bacterium]
MTPQRLPPLAFRLLLAAASVALIVVATALAARRADRLLRADLLLQARLVAQAVDLNAVRALAGTDADLASPDYWRLKNQLMSIVQANPKCKWFYLMGRKTDGTVFFFVDSEAPDVEDASPPGQLYEEASEGCHLIFVDPTAFVEGPIPDRWGVWVSALVPMIDPETGSVTAVLGMDIEAQDWKWIVAARAALPATLAAIAVLLGLLAVLLQQSRRTLRARQKELQESESRFVQLAEQSRTVVWETDFQGLFTHVSPAVEPVLGYRPDELAGLKHFYDLHPEEGREAFKQAALQTFERKEPFVNSENPATTKDGKPLWLLTNGIPLLNADGSLRGYRGSDVDITERKRSEEQVRALLAESNQSRQALLGILEDQMRTEADRQRLAAAIEQSAESIVVTDAKARIQYVNPAFEAVTGYSREEAIGQNPRILQSGQQDAAFYQTMWETLASGKTWQGRMVNKRKDGALYTEDAVLSPVCDATGAITNFVAVKRDVTEQLRLAGQLQQSQKMDSIGRLAGGVAHDFNNMLGVILGHAEIAMDQTDLDHPLRADLLEIRKAAQRSADLTRQLLAFARKQIVAPKVLDLNETVEGMLKMLRRLIGENIDLAWRPGRHLWPVKMDPSQIDQILANLCVNARDAIAGVGQVAIETDTVTLDPARAAESPGAVPGDYVRLVFRDTGAGMDPETLSHIFEPFFTTKKLGENTGLGLSTVYGIVQQNNGFIQVQSVPGQGTTFQIHLPRHGDKTDPVPQEESAAPAPGGHETILLVEDEPAILNTTAQMIETLGYAVWKAGSAAEALRLAEEPGRNIHLLVTDVVMPDMNGRDMAQKIRALRPEIKCLFMSGYTADIIARNGVLDGGVYFIQKPFPKKNLAIQIREALDS